MLVRFGLGQRPVSPAITAAVEGVEEGVLFYASDVAFPSMDPRGVC